MVYLEKEYYELDSMTKSLVKTSLSDYKFQKESLYEEEYRINTNIEEIEIDTETYTSERNTLIQKKQEGNLPIASEESASITKRIQELNMKVAKNNKDISKLNSDLKKIKDETDSGESILVMLLKSNSLYKEDDGEEVVYNEDTSGSESTALVPMKYEQGENNQTQKIISIVSGMKPDEGTGKYMQYYKFFTDGVSYGSGEEERKRGLYDELKNLIDNDDTGKYATELRNAYNSSSFESELCIFLRQNSIYSATDFQAYNDYYYA